MSNKLENAIRVAQRAKGYALAVFTTCGFPHKDSAVEVGVQAVKAGVDVLELGIPFSDPLADGPIIQNASQVALANGMTVGECLRQTALITARVSAPVVLMGYLNPILAMGAERFFRSAEDAGAQAVVVADLPPAQADPYAELAARIGIGLVPLVASTSTAAGLEKAASYATGFIYCVALKGVTGATTSNHDETRQLVQRVRSHTALPTGVGFGIADKKATKIAGEYADCVIIGSAFIKKLAKSVPHQAPAKGVQFIESLM